VDRTGLEPLRRRRAHARATRPARQRIARELHDIVSHSLGLLVFQAGVGEQLVDADPEKAREAFRSIRLAGRKARNTGAAVEFGVHGEPPPLSAAIELSLYRIAQEALTNAIKHAPSAPVRIDVRAPRRMRRCRGSQREGILDGGPWRGAWLIGLGERVAIFGGRIEVGQRPDGGWRLAGSEITRRLIDRPCRTPRHTARRHHDWPS
jgi:glucose-6-phosphate-specific signal transduction histidine kinase